LQRGSAI